MQYICIDLNYCCSLHRNMIQALLFRLLSKCKCSFYDKCSTFDIFLGEATSAQKQKNDYDFEVGISDSLASLKSSIRPARLNAATGIRVESKALTSITARHSVAGAITYPNGRWKRGKSLMGRDTAQQLRGRPVRRQNKSTLSLWFCPCALSLVSCCRCCCCRCYSCCYY